MILPLERTPLDAPLRTPLYADLATRIVFSGTRATSRVRKGVRGGVRKDTCIETNPGMSNKDKYKHICVLFYYNIILKKHIFIYLYQNNKCPKVPGQLT